MLQIDQLSYRIKNHQILDRLNLSVSTGQYYALAGENGAGKSTLIKITLDLIREVERGRITIAGKDHKKIQVRALIAYLPEKFSIPKEVTGHQYLSFVLGMYQQKFDAQRLELLCHGLGFDAARLQHRVSDYSKGMKQKLGLISCFILKTPLIILDEPLSGLDPKARFLFKTLLSDERANGRTIFYSTHMLADAEELCDQFGILHGGRIVFEGTPKECIRQFQADTLEEAYMNCISGVELSNRADA